MKNSNIRTLKQVVPMHIRLQVYREALEYYKNEGYIQKGEDNYFREGYYSEGLCLVLPCILWGLYNYLDFSIEWDYMDTPIAFPELDPTVLYVLMRPGTGNLIRTRMEYLEKWVKDLEHELRN